MAASAELRDMTTKAVICKRLAPASAIIKKLRDSEFLPVNVNFFASSVCNKLKYKGR
jgi:hypothetical protein